ncbi:F-box domain protein [Metarhizium robertsii]|uniref:F-box domain, cyclin-like protein n=2 Tax=Metarhizium robertsii TaxID=568076 RepID=E9F254_METRA|nr:F-box domain, cyclin-like protein [Metarhizium robertsii ARSEF 23]EFY98143.1 F-box domain, cyclin-like protein [Metarhizium robertsii ARSEF 23]EXV01515.1 F-box domain protein [Metarhizium robertsii]
MSHVGYSVSNHDLRMVDSGDSMLDELLLEKLSYRYLSNIEQYVSRWSKDIEIKEPRMDYDPKTSVGHLEKLPIEILHNVFEMLDFQSLLRFSGACRRASILVQTSPVYRDLIEYAHRGLAALAFSGLIGHHPAGALRAALRSQNCFSCGHYGQLLFLPSCQRCCRICASRNQSLWVLPRGVAAKCFRIPLRQVDQLPGILRLLMYPHGRFATPKPESFVSVACAKRLALAIHGSEKKITDLPISTRLSDTKRELYAHYRAAQLRPYTTDPLLISTTFNDIEDPHESYAHIYLPSIASGVVYHGFLCRGCLWMRQNYHPKRDKSTSLVPMDRGPADLILRARSREGFLRHIRMCFGVRLIVATNGLEHWGQEIAHIPINQLA